MRALPVILLPAWGFYAGGNRRLAWGALAAYAVFLLLGFAFVGLFPASLAGGLLIAIHAAGIVYCVVRLGLLQRRSLRVAGILTILLALIVFLYRPAMDLAGRAVFPLRTPESNATVIVNALTSKASIERGDVVGYRIREVGAGTVRVQAGYGLDVVVALPGDRVAFFEETVEVNGEPQPRRARMPTSGELIVPNGHWFIWPAELEFRGNQDALGREMLRGMALVPGEDIIGKPFKRWFLRQQPLEAMNPSDQRDARNRS